MSENAITGLVTAAAGILAAVVLAGWIASAPARDLGLRTPLEHARAGATDAPPVDLRGRLRTFDGRPSDLEGFWPGFRGPRRDNVASSEVIARAWAEKGPDILWSVDLGEGHAGPAVAHGRVYLLDYDETEKADALRCFSLQTGEEIWRRSYAVRVKRNHGMSRTVPAVEGRFVVTLGPKCHVVCADAFTGDFLWGVDLVADWGTEVPLWYTGQCPLIDGGVAVLAPAGRALLIGVDLETGRVLWETPNPGGWSMSHASVVEMTLLGKRMYVYTALGGIAGASAEDADRGGLLFSSGLWKPTVAAPSPVALPGDRILVTAGYGMGSAILKAKEEGGEIRLEEEARIDRSVFACEQHTPVLFRDRLFTVLPKDAGALRQQLVCADLSLRPIWNSGKTLRFGLGPFLVAGEEILVLDDRGTLTLAEATGDAFEVLASARVLEGRDAWAPMALAAGRLLLRDSTRMICLDLRGGGGG